MIPFDASHSKTSTILPLHKTTLATRCFCSFLLIRVITSISNESEQQKSRRDAFKKRVVQAKKGSFEPLINSTSGRMGPVCNVFIKREMDKLAHYKNKTVSIMTIHVRKRLRFEILRSTVIALRGLRGKSDESFL